MPGVRVLAVPSLAALLTHLQGQQCPAGIEPVEVIEGGAFPGSADGLAGSGAGVAAAGPAGAGRAVASAA